MGVLFGLYEIEGDGSFAVDNLPAAKPMAEIMGGLGAIILGGKLLTSDHVSVQVLGGIVEVAGLAILRGSASNLVEAVREEVDSFRDYVEPIVIG